MYHWGLNNFLHQRNFLYKSENECFIRIYLLRFKISFVYLKFHDKHGGNIYRSINIRLITELNNALYNILSWGWNIPTRVDLGGPVVIIPATVSEVRGIRPGRVDGLFSEHKNPEYEFPRKGSKAAGPVS